MVNFNKFSVMWFHGNCKKLADYHPIVVDGVVKILYLGIYELTGIMWTSSSKSIWSKMKLCREPMKLCSNAQQQQQGL